MLMDELQKLVPLEGVFDSKHLLAMSFFEIYEIRLVVQVDKPEIQLKDGM